MPVPMQHVCKPTPMFSVTRAQVPVVDLIPVLYMGTGFHRSTVCKL